MSESMICFQKNCLGANWTGLIGKKIMAGIRLKMSPMYFVHSQKGYVVVRSSQCSTAKNFHQSNIIFFIKKLTPYFISSLPSLCKANRPFSLG